MTTVNSRKRVHQRSRYSTNISDSAREEKRVRHFMIGLGYLGDWIEGGEGGGETVAKGTPEME